VAIERGPAPATTRRNHLHSQFAQRPAHLRQPVRVHLAAGLRREPDVATAVRIQRAEQALPLDDHAQFHHHGHGRFLLHQLRVIDLAGRGVQNHDQLVPALALKPRMALSDI